LTGARVDVNARDACGNTALHHAVSQEDTQLKKIWLNHPSIKFDMKIILVCLPVIIVGLSFRSLVFRYLINTEITYWPQIPSVFINCYGQYIYILQYGSISKAFCYTCVIKTVEFVESLGLFDCLINIAPDIFWMKIE